jgi:serine/threonine protein kinase
LHSLKIVHGDLKDVSSNSMFRNTHHQHILKVNILIDRHGTARITDFGLTLVGWLTAGRVTTEDGHMGTRSWMAPERFTATAETRQTTACDVYAYSFLCITV